MMGAWKDLATVTITSVPAAAARRLRGAEDPTGCRRRCGGGRGREGERATIGGRVGG